MNDCRQIGINCPIVPGIMPINNYRGFLRMTGFCKTKVIFFIFLAKHQSLHMNNLKAEDIDIDELQICGFK